MERIDMSTKSWEAFAKEVEFTLNGRGQLTNNPHESDVRDLVILAESMDMSSPETVSWRKIHHGSLRPQETGTLLEMVLSMGGFKVYEGGRNETGDRARVEALVDLGRVLIQKGVPLTSGLVEIACDTSRQDLDSEAKLKACEAWGMDRAFNGQKAASLCALGGAWQSNGVAENIWKWLLGRGALNGAEKWTHCEQNLNPAVCALKDRDWKAFGRAAEAGVALDWTDPESGATLWHFACIGGRQMSKNALPLLQKSGAAAKLVNAQTHTAENFGERAWTVAPGATALHCAVGELEIDAVRCLLGLGANPNLIDGKGRSPLHILGNRWGSKAQDKAEAIIRLLMENGANPGLVDKEGRTAAQAMAAKAPLGALAVLLAERPADIGGEAPAQKAAMKDLAGRNDGEALALGEEAAMRVIVESSKKAIASAAPAKPGTRSGKRI